VTTRDGEAIAGEVASRDEFTIAVIDADGRYRSWATEHVDVTIDDPLEAHVAQLARYTDATMHDVLAYLHTLR
jgi:cytochrome c oxidase cbb3-type subunit 3